MTPWPTLVTREQLPAILLLVLATSTESAPLAWTYTAGNYSWAVAVSHDGQYIVAGSDDVRTYFFKTDSDGIPLWTHPSSGYVRNVAISDDGSRAAVGDMEGNILFFRSESDGEPSWSHHLDSPVSALALSENGDFLVAGNRRGELYAFITNLPSPTIWQTTIAGGILAISISKSMELAVAGSSGGVHFFSRALESVSIDWSYENHTTFPFITIEGGSGRIVAGGTDGEVYLITPSGEFAGRQHIGGAVTALSVSRTGQLVVAGSTNGRVSLYDLGSDLNEIGSLVTGSPVTAVAVSDNGEKMSVARMDGTITMYQHSLNNQAWLFDAGAIVHSVSMSGDGQVLAAATDTGSIHMFKEDKITSSGWEAPSVGILLIAVVLAATGIPVWRRLRRKASINGAASECDTAEGSWHEW